MLNILLRWILFTFALIFTAWIVPGISVENFISALIACLLIGIINAIIRPLVEFIAIPINILTLGLFTFVTNALLFMLAGTIAPGVEVEGFFSALIGSIILSLLASLINKL